MAIDPTKKHKSKLISILKDILSKGNITGKIYNCLYPTAENSPKFYGLPKVHKENTPLRPIVSSCGSINYNTSKHLAGILGPLVGHSDHHVKNRDDFVSKIKDLEVPPGQTLVSFDVTSLFTSIPVDKALAVLQARH